MNSNKFFLYVRRFNALVPSLVLLLMAALMVWAISSDTRGSHAKTLVPPGQDAQSVDNPLELRWLDVDVGPAHSLMQVVQITGSRTRYGPREESRNLVVIGVDTGTVNWVFPSQAQEVSNIQALRHEGQAAQGLYLEAQDTDDAPKTSEKRLKSIYVVKLDGSQHHKVLSGVDAVMNKRTDKHLLRVIYQKDNSVRLARIDLQNFRLQSDVELAKLSDPNK